MTSSEQEKPPDGWTWLSRIADIVGIIAAVGTPIGLFVLARLRGWSLVEIGLFSLWSAALVLWIFNEVRRLRSKPRRADSRGDWLTTAVLGFKPARVEIGDSANRPWMPTGVSDLYLELKHSGPTCLIKVQAVSVTGAARTPWSVRWDGSKEESRQLVTGHPELLHLCRVDAVNYKQGNSWKPGKFTFYSTSDEIEVLLADDRIARTVSDIYKMNLTVTLNIVAVATGEFTTRKFRLGINQNLSLRIEDEPA